MSLTDETKVKVIYQTSACENPLVVEFPIHDFISIHENASVRRILETIYRQMNHVDGSEWVAQKQMRSMSVGDMVVIAWNPYMVGVWLCKWMGWEKIA